MDSDVIDDNEGQVNNPQLNSKDSQSTRSTNDQSSTGAELNSKTKAGNPRSRTKKKTGIQESKAGPSTTVSNQEQNKPGPSKSTKGKGNTNKGKRGVNRKHHQPKSRPQSESSQIEQPTQQPMSSKEDKVFNPDDIHSILTSKRANNKIYYRVKWKDPERGNTWEYGSSIPDAI
ncbi:uncharacterized protein DDB_G0280579-like [Haliotis asinina]|uniref:uncharacterized protein DDB_G0280579-like n=1 Tax=Haliotis asinina TaxID=109174 RepID=UPI003531F3CB